MNTERDTDQELLDLLGEPARDEGGAAPAADRAEYLRLLGDLRADDEAPGPSEGFNASLRAAWAGELQASQLPRVTPQMQGRCIPWVRAAESCFMAAAFSASRVTWCMPWSPAWSIATLSMGSALTARPKCCQVVSDFMAGMDLKIGVRSLWVA